MSYKRKTKITRKEFAAKMAPGLEAAFEGTKSESITEEATRLVTGMRRKDYGHPIEDFSRTAKIWSAILGIDVTPNQVALCMVGVKISRQVNTPKRDNLVDAVGYILTLEMVEE